MGGVHEIFRAHSLGVAETQSLPEAHGAPVGLAHHSIPAPGSLTVVRNCVALDTLDQVGSLASVSGYCFGAPINAAWRRGQIADTGLAF